jgi:NAD(P)-dependent dehydrogenase (short-subunit alcohol dehydrogenase family)
MSDQPSDEPSDEPSEQPDGQAQPAPQVAAGSGISPPPRAPADPLGVFSPTALAGQVAVVTGGGSGIGRVTALGMARLGADVVVVGRRAELLDAVADEVRALGRAALVVPTNIREPAAVDELRDRAYERFGHVDAVVNNAGGQFPALPSQITDNGWRAVVDLNLNGTWNVVSRFMEPMVEAGTGSIVNVVHIFSFERGAPWFVHSGAARAGVVSMTRSLAPYLGYHGVTINALAPGTVATPGMHDNEVGQLGYDEEAWASTTEQIAPMRRMGTADEVAAAICFLCSPAARFVNGAALVQDGAELRTNWPRFFERGEY